MDKESKIYIAGHKGMVGSAIWRKLKSNGYDNLYGRSKDQLNLKNQDMVYDFKNEKFDVVINAAAKVGGILANNNYPYELL